MPILLLFAFISGLLTILAPCIWPLLPIIFSTSTGGKGKSLGISLGVVISFSIFTLSLSYLVSLFSFDPDILRLLAVVILTFLGLTLLVPKLTGIFEVLFSKLTRILPVASGGQKNGFVGGLLTGLALGVVWSPCAGPILSTVATLAATRAVNWGIILVTLAYSTGVFIILYFFSYGGSLVLTKARLLTKYTASIQRVFGLIIILTALLIYTNYDKTIQAKLLDSVPAYSSFIYKLESIGPVDRALTQLTGGEDMPDKSGTAVDPVTNSGEVGYGETGSSASKYKRLYKAPEITGIYKWLNTDKPLTIAGLSGKVVLVDFWTYTCINCIRTLPYVTSWYDKYKQDNFVVLGIHTPEFEFEKKTENVENAIKQYNIGYPVAQDNDYLTWQAFNNRYWPAKYLIDKDGYVRKYHFGEGGYDEMEQAIRDLIAETGVSISGQSGGITGAGAVSADTPESYLGFARMERFSSNEDLSLGTKTYSVSGQIPLNNLAYEGKWEVTEEYGQSFAGSALYLNFSAEKVFLVIHPGNGQDKVKVYLDGEPISDQVAGSDVKGQELTVDEAKLYNLVDLKGKKGQHLLKLEFLNSGTRIFAFTFG